MIILMNLSNTKIKGDFRWRSVYNVQLKLLNCTLVNDIKNDKNDFIIEIKLDQNIKETIQNVEHILRGQLSKDNCYLKTNLINNDVLSIKLWCNRRQIKTTIHDNSNKVVDYSSLKKNSIIDIYCMIDSLWAHKRYYPNFIYKLKPEAIQFCE